MAVDASAAAPSSSSEAKVPPAAAVGGSEDEDMLAQALALSMGGASGAADDAMDVSEEDEIQRAIALSMQEQSEAAGEQGSGSSDQGALLSSVLGSLPGVDPNDPRIQEALRRGGKPGDAAEGDGAGGDAKKEGK
ncbi:hypothetical protein HK405_006122 [Cladochytrium tenue]|nr:hypothetical protein HK405_006122 [Cladochytrium tenue]